MRSFQTVEAAAAGNAAVARAHACHARAGAARLPLNRYTCAVLFAACLLGACSQSSGQACQNNSDCDTGLVCDIRSSSRDNYRGVCLRPSQIKQDAGSQDASEPTLLPDDAGDDAGKDASPPADNDAG